MSGYIHTHVLSGILPPAYSIALLRFSSNPLSIVCSVNVAIYKYYIYYLYNKKIEIQNNIKGAPEGAPLLN
jgi:hypothetical protein